MEIIDMSKPREGFAESLVGEMLQGDDCAFALLCSEETDGREYISFDEYADGLRVGLVSIRSESTLRDALDWLWQIGRFDMIDAIKAWYWRS